MSDGYVRKRAVDDATRPSGKPRGTTKIVKATMVQPRPTTNSKPGALVQVRHGLNSLASSLTKPRAKAARKPEPAVKADSISATGMHGLRSALGLRTASAAECERTAKEASERMRKLATKDTNAGGEGRAVDVPVQVAPTFVNRPTTSVQEFTPTGDRLPQQDPALAQVYMAVAQLYVAAHRLPVTLDTGELAAITGLTPVQVSDAIVELERRRLLTRQPNRAGGTQRWAPAAL